MNMQTTTPAGLALKISRIFNAPREQVFDAWLQPEALKQWFGPGDSQVTDVQMDPVAGGAYRFEIHGGGDCVDKDAEVHIPTGKFLEISRPEKLAFTWAFEGGEMPETTVTVTFTEVEEGTRIDLLQEGFLDPVIQGHHDQGWNGCLSNLETYLS